MTLAGTLNAASVGGFTPTTNTVYTVLTTSASITGTCTGGTAGYTLNVASTAVTLTAT